jgi:hypothetical protein
MWEQWVVAELYLAGCASVLMTGSRAEGVDEPVVQVSAGSVTPARLEVHLGEGAMAGAG